jgi:hypothetical protein
LTNQFLFYFFGFVARQEVSSYCDIHEVNVELSHFQDDDDLRGIPEFRSRKTLDQAQIQLYAQAMKNDAFDWHEAFLPLVFFVGGQYILIDGHLRAEALKSIGDAYLPCRIKVGTYEEAWKASLSANAGHGLKRTDEDAKHAVYRVLSNPDYSNVSDSIVSTMTGVPFQSIAGYRKQLESENRIQVVQHTVTRLDDTMDAQDMRARQEYARRLFENYANAKDRLMHALCSVPRAVSKVCMRGNVSDAALVLGLAELALTSKDLWSWITTKGTIPLDGMQIPLNEANMAILHAANTAHFDYDQVEVGSESWQTEAERRAQIGATLGPMSKDIRRALAIVDLPGDDGDAMIQSLDDNAYAIVIVEPDNLHIAMQMERYATYRWCVMIERTGTVRQNFDLKISSKHKVALIFEKVASGTSPVCPPNRGTDGVVPLLSVIRHLSREHEACLTRNSGYEFLIQEAGLYPVKP